jgi:tRNA pseudouridine65 synthase
MKHIFHPIIGDTSHGDGVHNAFFRQQFNCHQLLLAATELSFTHPTSGEAISITAPLDSVFSQIVGNLGWQDFSVRPEPIG